MEIKLKKHNEETFKNVKKLFKDNNRVAVEQATGTGKSYITAKVISQLSKKRTLYITSSNDIIREFINSEDLGNIVNIDKIDFITYQKTLTFNIEDESENEYDLIILDEYHRVGAKKWFISVNTILNSFPKAKVLGTTGTPIRYLDNQRNMSEELFNNVIANKITLSRAINENILTRPKYILGTYDYNISLNVESISKRAEVLKKVKYLTSNLETLYGIPNILRKYITNERKFIVFCESTNHLNEIKDTVFRWFKDAFKEDVNIYSVHSKKKNNMHDYNSFKNSSNGFNLLFVVNMLNEGIHIDVDGLFFLRGTKSAIIYYQQLGRALTTSHKTPALVFDFVKNTKNILSKDVDTDSFKGDSFNLKTREETNVDYQLRGYFDIFDESIDFYKTVSEIEFHLSDWMEKYGFLIDYKEENRHLNIPSSNSRLHRFLLIQKKKYYQGTLEPEKIMLLEKLGVEWDYIDKTYESRWRNRLDQIEYFKKTQGHLNIPRSETSLYKFISAQRSLYSKGQLSESRINDLKRLGVDLNSKKKEKKVLDNDLTPKISLDELWEKRYLELKIFKKEYGHCNVPRKYSNSLLGEWVHTQRFNKNKLSPDRKEKLLNLGFEFNLAKKNSENQWNEMFKELIKYRDKFGDCNVSSRYENKKLANWVATQRKTFKAGKLSQDRYDKLIEIGFKMSSK